MGLRDGWLDQLISWRKRSRNKQATDKQHSFLSKDKSEQQRCHPWFGEVKVDVQVYMPTSLDIRLPASPLPEAPNDWVRLHSEVEFDPERHYAQVLSEARSHLKISRTAENDAIGSWPREMLPQHDIDAYTELRSKLSKPSRPSKVRRYLFFWSRQSNMSNSQAEVEYGGIFSSVPHPTSHISDNGTARKGKARGYTTYSSRTVRKCTSGPINHQPGGRMKGNSSPLYTDGLPDGPYNLKQPRKSYSGPIGYNNYESYSSPYRPLHGYPTASPLYSC